MVQPVSVENVPTAAKTTSATRVLFVQAISVEKGTAKVRKTARAQMDKSVAIINVSLAKKTKIVANNAFAELVDVNPDVRIAAIATTAKFVTSPQIHAKIVYKIPIVPKVNFVTPKIPNANNA